MFDMRPFRCRSYVPFFPVTLYETHQISETNCVTVFSNYVTQNFQLASCEAKEMPKKYRIQCHVQLDAPTGVSPQFIVLLSEIISRILLDRVSY